MPVLLNLSSSATRRTPTCGWSVDIRGKEPNIPPTRDPQVLCPPGEGLSRRYGGRCPHVSYDRRTACRHSAGLRQQQQRTRRSNYISNERRPGQVCTWRWLWLTGSPPGPPAHRSFPPASRLVVENGRVCILRARHSGCSPQESADGASILGAQGIEYVFPPLPLLAIMGTYIHTMVCWSFVVF
jgi:hypothetical protein